MGPVNSPQIAVLLNMEKGGRALAAYRIARTNLCRTAHSDARGAPAALERAGLSGADVDALCADAGDAWGALASGSFDQVGVDEVVLAVSSGMDRASGDHALALMRSDGTRYQFAGYLALGNDNFEAHVRITTANGPDILMLCNHYGQMGVYPSTCGFLGRGHFQRGTIDPGARDEIGLVEVTTCGPGASVSMGEVTLHERTLQVGLLVDRFILERNGPAESSGDLCTLRTPKGHNQYSVDYELVDGHFQRSTPIPAEVTDVLSRI